MIGPILAVTMTVSDLAPIEAAYTNYFGYQVIERGKIDTASAAAWNTPKIVGNDYIVMQPASKAPHYLRFIVTAPYPDYRPFMTYGWNSTELLVKDVDAMGEKLKNSPFEIVGPPRNLSSSDDIKAMQVMGPAKEFIYLTQVKADRPELGKASSDVDRVFIVIDGGKDMKELQAFWRGMGAQVSEPNPVRLSALNKMHGIDLETRHPLALARLQGPFSVEVDQYPSVVKPRIARDGDLPPGTAMVTFAVDSIAGKKHPTVAAPSSLKSVVYQGGRSAVIKGPNGEWVELVEKP